MASTTFECTDTVMNGKLSPAISQSIAGLMRRMEGRKVSIAIKEARKRRSNKQNAYYFGVVVPAITQMFLGAGNDMDKEQVHEFLKLHVGGLKAVATQPNGVKLTVAQSSSKLTTVQWEDYCEKIRAWAAQFGVQVPLPNEYV